MSSSRQGAVIVITCMIFTAFSSSLLNVADGASATNAVWTYVSQTSFSMLVGAIKMSDRVCKEMMGL